MAELAANLGAGVAMLIGAGLCAAVAGVIMRRTAKTVDGEVVPADIEALAAAAGVSPDVYACARVAASEAGGQKRTAKLGVVFVVVNEAIRRGVSPFEVVLGSAQAFGPQGTGGRSFVSSARDPQPIDFEAADDVVGGAVDDLTFGAVNFDSPGAYKDKYDNDGNLVQTAAERAATFAANRQREGKRLVLLDGVPEKTFRFWGRA
jgi:hypothetical protein